MNFEMFNLVLEKPEEPEIKLPTSTGSSKKQESSRKTSIPVLLTVPKPLKYWAGGSTSWDQDCWEKEQYLRYADDTTLLAESEEELKSLLMKVKEESEKVGLKLILN